MKKLIVLFALFTSCLLLAGCVERTDQNGTPILPTPSVTPTPDQSSIKKEDTKVGTGAEVIPGDTISVHYVGTLSNGTQFGSSTDQPFQFTIGDSSVIQGWSIGIVGMQVGGTRKLTIPPEFAYGAQVKDNIPANATLTFVIDLLSIDKTSN